MSTQLTTLSITISLYLQPIPCAWYIPTFYTSGKYYNVMILGNVKVNVKESVQYRADFP